MYPVEQQQQQQVNTVSGMQQLPPPSRVCAGRGCDRVPLTFDEKSRRQTLAYGVVLVVFGLLIGGLVSVLMTYFGRSYIACGYATTGLYIVCGSIAIWTVIRNHPRAVKVFMFLIVQAAIWSLILIIVSVVYSAKEDEERVTASLVVEIVLIVSTFVGGVFCLVISILFCKASHCAKQEAISCPNQIGCSPYTGKTVVSYGGQIETTQEQQQQPYPGMMPAPQMMPTGAPIGPPTYNNHQQYPQNWTSLPNYDNIAAECSDDKI